jgi:uncharacterized protein (UPF0303 family)
MSNISNTAIKLKKSGIAGNTPLDLNFGELALNYADGRLYYKNADGQIVHYQAGGGGSSDSFATINVNSTLVFATSNTDTLSFVGSNGVSVTANAQSKTIKIDGNDIITLAQAAFDKANTGVTTSTDQWSRDKANASFTLAQASFDYANTIISDSQIDQWVRDVSNNTVLHANSAFDKANASTLLAQAAFDKANTGVTISTDQWSRDTANAAFNKANTDAILAQAAFDKANTGTTSSTDQYARDKANLSFNKANTSLTVGQSAYDFANSISISGSSNQIVNGNSNFAIDSTGVVTLNNRTTEFSNASFISTSGVDTIIDTFPITHRTAKYIIQAITGNEIHSKELIVVNNGNTANYLQYSDVKIGDSLMTVYTEIIGTDVNVKVQTSKVNTVIDFVRKTLFKSDLAPSVPSGDLGLVSEIATLIFDNGYDLETVTNSFDYGYLA